MSNIVTFSNFKNTFNTLNCQNICDNILTNQLFDFLPMLFNYEEEGEKLTFDILIFPDFKKTSVKLPGFLFKQIITVQKDILNLKKHIKSIAPFSKNAWNIYISVENESYNFGIFKDLSGIDAVSLNAILRDNFIEIIKLDKDIIEFHNDTLTFHLHMSIIEKDISDNRKENVLNLVDSVTSSLSDPDNKKSFIKVFANYLFNAFEKTHGTIIVVVEEDEELDSFFAKGVILESPINLYSEYINYINNCSKNESIIQRYYSLMGLLSIALNIDGITILNTNAELLAYNIFIDNDSDVDTNVVSGGARKRAAYAIEKKEISTVNGLYFQSHDGESSFKEFNE